MGNCCQKRKEKVIEVNTVELSVYIRDVEIQIMKGNICNEEIDGIVNWCDCFLMNQRTYVLKQVMNPELKIELDKEKASKGVLTLNDCFSTGAGSLTNVKNLIHSTLPLWRGGTHKELEQLEESITQCIKLALELNLTSIAFTQDSSDLFGIPLQNFAETIVQSFYRFAKLKETFLKKVVFIHQDPKAIQYYVSRLKAISGEPSDDIISIYSDKLRDFYLSDCSNTSSSSIHSKREGNNRYDDFEDFGHGSSNNLLGKK